LKNLALIAAGLLLIAEREKKEHLKKEQTST
jgi:hypothetical protein